MTIRSVESRDLEELVDLCSLHAEYERADYDPTNKAELLEKYLFGERPILHCLVVEAQGGGLLGYATYIEQFATWEAAYYLYLDCLYIREGQRSKGLGAQLMDQIKSEAQRLGCTHIQWHTPDFNKRAIQFYKRIGAYHKTKERFFWEF